MLQFCLCSLLDMHDKLDKCILQTWSEQRTIIIHKITECNIAWVLDMTDEPKIKAKIQSTAKHAPRYTWGLKNLFRYLFSHELDYQIIFSNNQAIVAFFASMRLFAAELLYRNNHLLRMRSNSALFAKRLIIRKIDVTNFFLIRSIFRGWTFKKADKKVVIVAEDS